MESYVLNDVEKEAIAGHYLKSIEELKGQQQELQTQIEAIEIRLKILGVRRLLNEDFKEPEEQYAADWTLAKKAAYVLNKGGKFLMIREIVDEINGLEGGHYTDYRKKELSDKLSSTLKQKVDKDDVFMRLDGAGTVYCYGLLIWKDKNGKVPRQYLK